MRRGFYLLIIFILIAGIVLAVYAPDNISMVFIAIMEAVIFLGIIFGILPTMQYERGFQTAMDNIASAVEGQNGSAWTTLEKSPDFFNQRTLDTLFAEYQAKVRSQRESGQILADIDDYINDDTLALHSWDWAA